MAAPNATRCESHCCRPTSCPATESTDRAVNLGRARCEPNRDRLRDERDDPAKPSDSNPEDSAMGATATQDEVIAFLEEQMWSKLQVAPPAAGTPEAEDADAEWAARWDAWMRPFARDARTLCSQHPVATDKQSLRQRTVRLEDRPNLLVCPDFCSADECQALIRLGARGSAQLARPSGWSPDWRGRQVAKRMLRMPPEGQAMEAEREEGRLLSMLAERAESLTGCNVLSSGGGGSCDGSTDLSAGCQLTFTAPETDGTGGATIGLHVDQNHGAMHRWATILVYLNTIEPARGGGTVFPCASRQSGPRRVQPVRCATPPPAADIISAAIPGAVELGAAERGAAISETAIPGAAEVGAAKVAACGRRPAAGAHPKRHAVAAVDGAGCGVSGPAERVAAAGLELLAMGLTSSSDAVAVHVSGAEVSVEAVEGTAAAAILCATADATIAVSRAPRGPCTSSSAAEEAGGRGEANPTLESWGAAPSGVVVSSGSNGVGLSVHPHQGSALVFYSTDACGSVDAWSWHGGAAVIADGHHLSSRAGAGSGDYAPAGVGGQAGAPDRPGVGPPDRDEGGGGKWTLQIFVALPVVVRGDTEATRAFLAEHMLP